MADKPNEKDNEDANRRPSEKDLPKKRESQFKFKRASKIDLKTSKSKADKYQEEPTPSTSRQPDPPVNPPNPYQKYLDSGEDPKLIEIKILQKMQRDYQRREMIREREALEARKAAQLQAASSRRPIESEDGAGPSGVGKSKWKGLSKPQQKPEPPEAQPETSEARRRRVLMRWRCVVRKIIRSKRNAPQ